MTIPVGLAVVESIDLARNKALPAIIEFVYYICYVLICLFDTPVINVEQKDYLEHVNILELAQLYGYKTA